MTQKVTRILPDSEVRRATALIFNTVGQSQATVYDGQGMPIYPHFTNLSPSDQEQAFRGLKVRIETEGLLGYIERKRKDWGSRATDSVLQTLHLSGIC